MAGIVGAYFTSQVSAIGGAIHRGDQQYPYRKPFFDGFPPVRKWLAKVKPDVAVVFSNDHGFDFTQRVEELNWIAARGALGAKAREIHRNYHMPISNTAAASMVFEPA